MAKENKECKRGLYFLLQQRIIHKRGKVIRGQWSNKKTSPI